MAIALCALAACAGDELGGDTDGTATTEIVGSLPAVQTFFANSGNGVAIRVADLGQTAFVPAFTVTDPAGTAVVNTLSANVASASFSAGSTGTFTLTIRDAATPPAPIADYAVYVAVAPGANTGGALSPGGAVNGHINEGELDSYTFSAAAGEGIALRVTDLANGPLVPAMTVYGPAGNALTSTSSGSVAGLGFAAPVTGTYTVLVYDASAGFVSTGDYRLYYTKAPGANAGGLLSPGVPVAGHIDEGELDSYTFTASTGESIALRITDVAGGALSPGFTIYGPTGAAVAVTSSANVASTSFAAATSGTYTLVVYDVSAGLASTGDYELYYTKAPGANAGGALSPGGAVDGHINEGELDSYTFTAAAGEGIALRVTDLANGPLVPAIAVYGPAGNAVTSTSSGSVAGLGFAAPVTGTYTVLVYDASAGFLATGDYRLYYTKAPGANAGGLLSPGVPVAGHIDEGELDSYTFTASTGESIALRITDVAGGALSPGFTIYGPTGAAVAVTSSANVASTSFAAATSGTYTLVVYDVSAGLASTGDYELYYTKAPGANAGGALSPGGAVDGHINEGALDSYTFSAAAGEGIALRVTDLANGALVPAIAVYGPTGSAVTSTSSSSVAGLGFAAPVTGTYTVLVYDVSAGFLATGDYRLYYTKAPGANAGGLLSPGVPVAGHIDEGELDSYTFTASTGESIALRITDVAGGALSPGFTIYGPTGAAVAVTSSANVASTSFAAATSGTYTLVVYDVSAGLASTGDYELYYTKAPGANAGGALSPGGAVDGHINEGEFDSYTFSAAAGEGIALRVTDLANGALVPAIAVYGPAGNAVTSTSSGSVAGLGFAAPVTGTYTVLVYDVSAGFLATGDYRLYYTKAPGANAGGRLSPGVPAAGHIDEGELDSYTFAGLSGQRISLQMTDVAAGALSPGFTIYGPTGAAVAVTSGATVASTTFTASLTGTYTVVAYDVSAGLASTGDYALALSLP